MKDDEDEQDEPVKADTPAPDVHGGAKSHEFKGDLAYLFNEADCKK